jgi:Protein of unknown function (DUF2793)
VIAETNRLSLPFIVAGQAQKEVTHNEALMRLDALVQASVEAVGLNAPPAAPQSGQCWIIGAEPAGAWTDHAHGLACWTQGGWRFAAAHEGMMVWSVADMLMAGFIGGAWTIGRIPLQRLFISGKQVVGEQSSAIQSPSAGTVVDTEARFAIGEILTALRNHGLVAT